MAKLLGKAPNQVPTNADLGTMAFQDREGINVNNAIVANLVVTGATSVTAPFAVTNATANVLYVGANGNIGIGTSTSNYKLYVVGAPYFDAAAMYLYSTASNTAAALHMYTANTSSNEYIRFIHPGGNVAFDTGYDTSASNWYINRFDTAGQYVNTPVVISRASGNITFATQMTTIAGGGLTLTGTNQSRSISITGNNTGTEAGLQLKTNTSSQAFAILAVGNTLVIKDDGDAAPRFELDTSANVFNFVGGNAYFSNSVSIVGNLTVSGTTTYINTTNLNIGDNIITLNADLGAVAPSENAGIEVNRGSSANTRWLWNEGRQRWGAYTDGTAAVVESYANTNAGFHAIAYGNSTSNTFVSVFADTTSAGIQIDGANSSGAGSTQTFLEIKAPDYRGAGMFVTQVTAPRGGANAHWFVGKPYTGGAFQIGYGASPEYQSNAVLFIGANTNFGIGTIAPYDKFHVAHNSNTQGTVTLFNANNDTTAKTQLTLAANTTSMVLYQNAPNSVTGEWGLYSSSATMFKLTTNAVSRFVVSANGNVGIGNNAPGDVLVVAGNTTLTSGSLRVSTGSIFLDDGNNTGTVLLQKAAGNTSQSHRLEISNLGGNSTVSASQWWNGLHFTPPTAFANSTSGTQFPRAAAFFSYTSNTNPTDLYFNLWNGNNGGVGGIDVGMKIYAVSGTDGVSRGFDIAANGNVGIGNTAPADKLSVNGTTYLGANTKTAGKVVINGATSNSNWLWVQGRSVLTANSTGTGTITTAGSAVIIGPSTQRGTVGQYMAGVGFNHLLNYSGQGDEYGSALHAWVGTRLTNTANTELAALVLGVKNNVDSLTVDETLTILPGGNVGIGNTAPADKLSVNGNIYANNHRRYTGTRTLSTTVNDTVDIGVLYQQHGAHDITVTIQVSDSSFSVAKHYRIVSQFRGDGTTYKKVLPSYDTGPFSGNDFDLEAYHNNETLSLRLRRTSGSTAGVAEFMIDDLVMSTEAASGFDSFTPSSTTATGVAAVTDLFQGNRLLQTGTGSSNSFVVQANLTTAAITSNSTSTTINLPVTFNAYTTMGNVSQNYLSLTTSTTTANQVVATAGISSWRSAKYLVQVTSGSAYQLTEISLIHDGTNVYKSEYGTVYTGAVLATFDADINSGNIRLLATPVNAVTTFKGSIAYVAV